MGYVVGAKKKKNCLVHFSVDIIILWVICLDKRQFVGISFFSFFFFFSGTSDKYGNLVLDSFEEDEHRIVAQISFDLQLSGTTC